MRIENTAVHPVLFDSFVGKRRKEKEKERGKKKTAIGGEAGETEYDARIPRRLGYDRPRYLLFSHADSMRGARRIRRYPSSNPARIMRIPV